MSEPLSNVNVSAKQWVVDSYVNHSVVVVHADCVHTGVAAPDRASLVKALGGLNLQRAAEVLRDYLAEYHADPKHVRIAVDCLALTPAGRAVDLLRRLDPPDRPLWGAVLLCMGKEQSWEFVAAMTSEQRKQTVRSAVEHLRRRCYGGGAADAAATLLDTDRRVAAELLATMDTEYCAQILVACSTVEDRTSLLDHMRPASVYRTFVSADQGTAPAVVRWFGYMKPDRVAAALTSTKKLDQHAVVTAARMLNAVQGPAVTAKMLIGARLDDARVDPPLRALGPLVSRDSDGFTWRCCRRVV